MEEHQKNLVEELKLNEARIQNVIELFLSIIKYYFTSAAATATIVTTLYHYGISTDLKFLAIFFIVPLLIFGFVVLAACKKLIDEHTYWISIRNGLLGIIYTSEVKVAYQVFPMPLKSFLSLLYVIIWGGFIALAYLVLPGHWKAGLIALIATIFFGIFSTIAVVALNEARKRSRDAKRVADIRQIQTALELYFSEHSSYPIQGTKQEPLVLGGQGFRALTSRGIVNSVEEKKDGTVYMGVIPANPEPGGVPYKFHSDGKNYEILFSLEGDVGNIKAGENIADSNGIKNLSSKN